MPLVRMQVYINRNDLDFASVATLPPIQEWDLVENIDGRMEYPTQCVGGGWSTRRELLCMFGNCDASTLPRIAPRHGRGWSGVFCAHADMRAQCVAEGTELHTLMFSEPPQPA